MAYRRMTRMISFRVSQDEFEQLRARSQAEGARSVSDYARLALARETGDSRQLLDHIQRLSADVHRLTEMMGPQRGIPAAMAPLAMAADKGWRES